MPQGFVYVLVSPNSNHIKIGGTERPISERLRGINGTQSYSDHGPWELSDFLHVTDWRLVEGEMHRHFQKHKVRDVVGTAKLQAYQVIDLVFARRATGNPVLGVNLIFL